MLRGDELGPPHHFALAYRLRDVAVSPDGTQLAFAGGPSSVDVANVATGRVRPISLSPDLRCGETTVVALGTDGALFASQSCQGGVSRLVERAADGKTRTVFEGDGAITGFTVAKREVYLDIRHDASELVVIEGL